MKKFLLSLLFLSSISSAYYYDINYNNNINYLNDLEDLILNYDMKQAIRDIDMVANEQGIDFDILYTIVKIESNFKPLQISFLTNEKNAKYFKKQANENIKVIISSYSLNRAKWVVNIQTNTVKRAKEITKILVEGGFSVDVGLGQLNSINYSLEEIDYIFDPVYNLRKCAEILRNCYKAKNGNLQKAIECYNYGTRERGSNPYYKRFYEHYMKEFKRKN